MILKSHNFLPPVNFLQNCIFTDYKQIFKELINIVNLFRTKDKYRK